MIYVISVKNCKYYFNGIIDTDWETLLIFQEIQIILVFYIVNWDRVFGVSRCSFWEMIHIHIHGYTHVWLCTLFQKELN